MRPRTQRTCQKPSAIPRLLELGLHTDHRQLSSTRSEGRKNHCHSKKRLESLTGSDAAVGNCGEGTGSLPTARMSEHVAATDATSQVTVQSKGHVTPSSMVLPPVTAAAAAEAAAILLVVTIGIVVLILLLLLLLRRRRRRSRLLFSSSSGISFLPSVVVAAAAAVAMQRRPSSNTCALLPFISLSLALSPLFSLLLNSSGSASGIGPLAPDTRTHARTCSSRGLVSQPLMGLSGGEGGGFQGLSWARQDDSDVVAAPLRRQHNDDDNDWGSGRATTAGRTCAPRSLQTCASRGRACTDEEEKEENGNPNEEY
ncbi:hypothetical protein SprV_0702371000 [Sparganum proliferum]